MIILKSTLELLNKNIKDIRFECGGIIGSSRNEVIDKIVLDKGEHPNIARCSYAPDTAFLNDHILRWQQQGIRFSGVFHTHFVGVKTLSKADEKYIKTIMNAMPKEIKYLYFPIFVLPERQLVGYVAKMNTNGIDIVPDEVFIE